MKSKILAIVMAASAFAGQQAFADECRENNGTDKILEVVDWSYKSVDIGAELTLSVSNLSAESYRLVDAHIKMVDVLGSEVLSTEFPPDSNLTAQGNSPVQIDLFLGGQRLAKLSKADVVSTICLAVAVTTEGKKVEFTK